MPPKKILLLEDDPIQAEWLVEQVIWRSFADADVRYYDSEYSFYQGLQLNEPQEWKPDYAILDLLIRYYSIEDLASFSQDFQLGEVEDPKQAGFRSYRALAKKWPTTKIAIMTVLNVESTECLIIQKGSDVFPALLCEFLTDPCTVK